MSCATVMLLKSSRSAKFSVETLNPLPSPPQHAVHEHARNVVRGEIHAREVREDRQVDVETVVAGCEFEVAAHQRDSTAQSQRRRPTFSVSLTHADTQRPDGRFQQQVVRRGVRLQTQFMQVEAERVVVRVDRQIEVDAGGDSHR